MLKRVISGAVFVAIVAGFFLLREFVDARLFQILIWFIAAVGTFEMARALSPHTSKPAFITATVFGVVIMPQYALFEYLLFPSYGWVAVLSLMALFVIMLSLIAVIQKLSAKVWALSLAPVAYPALFILAMALINDLQHGFIAMLLVFVIAPCADTFAYFVGSLIGGPKLCPKLSPKKTWSGAIGGIAGGVIGCIIAWAIFRPQVNFFSPALLFAIIGVAGSILTIIGDLFESFIKRKLGLKDMGNIMPGHGGMLDRFDGSFFASVMVYLIFLFV